MLTKKSLTAAKNCALYLDSASFKLRVEQKSKPNKENYSMNNNQINNPNEDLDQLSDEELDVVAGGGFFDKVKDVAKDAVDKVKDSYDDAKKGYQTIKKYLD
jgi:hypothetical protein